MAAPGRQTARRRRERLAHREASQHEESCRSACASRWIATGLAVGPWQKRQRHGAHPPMANGGPKHHQQFAHGPGLDAQVGGAFQPEWLQHAERRPRHTCPGEPHSSPPTQPTGLIRLAEQTCAPSSVPLLQGAWESITTEPSPSRRCCQPRSAAPGTRLAVDQAKRRSSQKPVCAGAHPH